MSRPTTTAALREKDFGGSGLRIAYRPGTVDEQAIQPWIEWLDQPAPRPDEPRPADVILDVGAHIGGFTLLAAGLVPEGHVLAVEASRESYEVLCHNIRLNGLTNVEATHMALAGRSGTVRLHHDPGGNWGHTIVKPVGGDGETTHAMSLAAFLDAKQVDHCDVAKLNCEGAEFEILLGAGAETLRRLGRIEIFYHGDLVDRTAPDELEHHLRAAGFELRRQPTSSERGRLTARQVGA